MCKPGTYMDVYPHVYMDVCVWCMYGCMCSGYCIDTMLAKRGLPLAINREWGVSPQLSRSCDSPLSLYSLAVRTEDVLLPLRQMMSLVAQTIGKTGERKSRRKVRRPASAMVMGQDVALAIVKERLVLFLVG